MGDRDGSYGFMVWRRDGVLKQHLQGFILAAAVGVITASAAVSTRTTSTSAIARPGSGLSPSNPEAPG